MDKKQLKIQLKTLKKLQRLTNFMPSYAELVVLCLAIASDSVLNFIVTEVLFTQAMWLSIFTAIMVAASMNVMLSIMGAIHLKLEKTKVDHILFYTCFAICGAFITLMSILRFDLMEEIFTTSNAVLVSSSYVATEATEFVASPAQIVMMIVCTLITISTSIFLFAIKIHKGTPTRAQEIIAQSNLAGQIAKVENQIHISELETDKNVDRGEMEKARLNQEVAQTKANQDRIIVDSSTALAKKLKDPHSANQVLEN